MRTLFKILGLSTILFTSCHLDKKEITKPDIVIQSTEYRLEGFFDRIEDSLSIYNCFLYDSDSKNLVTSGKHIIYSDNLPLPFGWFEFWNDEGKLAEKIQYIANSKSRTFEINQNIKFGVDTNDTVFQESNFLKHNLNYLNEDTVEIMLIYRGWKENESNYAFVALTDIDNEFVFRTNNPKIIFKLPIKKFMADSNITILMIKTSDFDIEQDLINMGHIYYDIELVNK